MNTSKQGSFLGQPVCTYCGAVGGFTHVCVPRTNMPIPPLPATLREQPWTVVVNGEIVYSPPEFAR